MKRIVIVGAGASGILAALRLADITRHCEIVLLEKNERIGKKLLRTGNGKCNITHFNASAADYESAFATDVFETFDYTCTAQYLASLGIYFHTDSAGRCYPLSESANNVLNLFLAALAHKKVRTICDYEIKTIIREGGKYLPNGDASLAADTLILAIGSAAGVKGYNGLDLVRSLGFRMERPRPALCPIPSSESFLKSLKGVRVKGTIHLGERAESGEIQFNEDSISGICAFNLAKYVRENTTLTLDFLADKCTKQHLVQAIRDRAQSAGENAALLDFLLLRRLALVILKQAGIQPSGDPAALREEDVERIASLVSSFPVRVQPAHAYHAAQTVCGGLSEAQVDKHTLQAKHLPGVFLCGEILDVDGPCGGYNLQWAWSSGMCAAQSAKEYVEKKH